MHIYRNSHFDWKVYMHRKILWNAIRRQWKNSILMKNPWVTQNILMHGYWTGSVDAEMYQNISIHREKN